MTNAEIFLYSLALIGSFIAGILNTFAGNGSVITLSIMTDVLGLPSTVANGTNRLGVLMQTLGSGIGFAKQGKLHTYGSGLYIILTVIGSVIGAFAVLMVTNAEFDIIFKYLILFMFIIVLINPEKWIQENKVTKTMPIWLTVPIYLLLGFYGGFIQMGMGVFLLAVMVLINNYSLLHANIVKNIIFFVYSLVVLVIFSTHGLIQWDVALILAVGQALGGYFAAQYGVNIPDINLWAYRLLVAVIFISLLIQFKVMDYLLL